MPSSVVTPPVAFSPLRMSDVDADVLYVPVCEDLEAGTGMDGLAAAPRDALARALASREFQAKPYELFPAAVPDGWRARRLVYVGCGRGEECTTDRLRRVASATGLAAKARRFSRVAFLNTSNFDAAAAAQAITEGLVLTAFSTERYKSGEPSGLAAEQLTVVDQRPGLDLKTMEEAVARGRILAESCNLARELCNEPSNVLTPAVFADRAAAIGRDAGLGVEVLDERDLQRLNMGLLLGVGRGSVEPPRMIVLEHVPPGAPATPVLGLIGKGVTFDTGGISIKPADGMERMKDDMAGGAAVIGAMRAIALLNAPIRVVGVIPSAENMPGGRAVKPGDVLTGASGKTVEVINTDAEGRLILGDGLWYAQRLGATHLIDVATLTGACVVALGRAASGLFGQPDAWVEVIRSVGQAAGDRLWPMPLYDDYADQLRSEIADIMNTGGRAAGACTAAMFLKEFAGELPWAHLDIAGTAWFDDAKPWQPKGPTAVAVRTMAELAFTSERWS